MTLNLFVRPAVQWHKHFLSLGQICLQHLISAGKYHYCDMPLLLSAMKMYFSHACCTNDWIGSYNLYKLYSAYIMINICGEKHLEYILVVIRILQMMNCKALIKKKQM